MIRDVGLSELYRGKANVWVEDPITRTYMRECWGDDPDIFFLIAGGNENIGAILKHAEDSGYTHVFGIADRDFRESNRASWFDPTKGFRRFVPTVHEVENFLLDDAALAGCACNTGKRTQSDIEMRLKARSGEIGWWMACRRVIVDLRDESHEGFIEHPKCPDVVDLPSAEHCIVGHDWFRSVAARLNAVTRAGEIRTRLNAAHRVVEAQLTDGSWKECFSGKELFHHVRGWIYTKPPAPASAPELDADVARAIAQWQVANKAVPVEVVELRRAIRGKAGLP